MNETKLRNSQIQTVWRQKTLFSFRKCNFKIVFKLALQKTYRRFSFLKNQILCKDIPQKYYNKTFTCYRFLCIYKCVDDIVVRVASTDIRTYLKSVDLNEIWWTVRVKITKLIKSVFVWPLFSVRFVVSSERKWRRKTRSSICFSRSCSQEMALWVHKN